MEENEKRLVFGKRYSVGNFTVMKVNRVLSKSEVAVLRGQMGIPMDERKKLHRSQLPFIKVEAVSGMWSVYFCCNTAVYRTIESWLASGDAGKVTTLAHMFTMMFMDTTVMGDGEYREDKARALRAFMERQEADVPGDAKAVVVDMRKGGAYDE